MRWPFLCSYRSGDLLHRMQLRCGVRAEEHRGDQARRDHTRSRQCVPKKITNPIHGIWIQWRTLTCKDFESQRGRTACLDCIRGKNSLLCPKPSEILGWKAKMATCDIGWGERYKQCIAGSEDRGICNLRPNTPPSFFASQLVEQTDVRINPSHRFPRALPAFGSRDLGPIRSRWLDHCSNVRNQCIQKRAPRGTMVRIPYRCSFVLVLSINVLSSNQRGVASTSNLEYFTSNVAESS
jgi:hypothetical protein